jgi:hypothetical protein
MDAHTARPPIGHDRRTPAATRLHIDVIRDVNMMDATDLFQQSVASIETAYLDLGHT